MEVNFSRSEIDFKSSATILHRNFSERISKEALKRVITVPGIKREMFPYTINAGLLFAASTAPQCPLLVLYPAGYRLHGLVRLT
jgi:hypothetical protein